MSEYPLVEYQQVFADAGIASCWQSPNTLRVHAHIDNINRIEFDNMSYIKERVGKAVAKKHRHVFPRLYCSECGRTLPKDVGRSHNNMYCAKCGVKIEVIES